MESQGVVEAVGVPEHSGVGRAREHVRLEGRVFSKLDSCWASSRRRAM